MSPPDQQEYSVITLTITLDVYTYVHCIDKDNFVTYCIHIELIFFCKLSGILCLKFNLFDSCRNTLPHLFVISHFDISLPYLFLTFISFLLPFVYFRLSD